MQKSRTVACKSSHYFLLAEVELVVPEAARFLANACSRLLRSFCFARFPLAEDIEVVILRPDPAPKLGQGALEKRGAGFGFAAALPGRGPDGAVVGIVDEMDLCTAAATFDDVAFAASAETPRVIAPRGGDADDAAFRRGAGSFCRVAASRWGLGGIAFAVEGGPFPATGRGCPGLSALLPASTILSIKSRIESSFGSIFTDARTERCGGVFGVNS